MSACYARVMTASGNNVHLARADNRHRPFNPKGRKTLCDLDASFSMEGCSDEVNCKRCLTREKTDPLPRRSA